MAFVQNALDIGGHVDTIDRQAVDRARMLYVDQPCIGDPDTPSSVPAVGKSKRSARSTAEVNS